MKLEVNIDHRRRTTDFYLYESHGERDVFFHFNGDEFVQQVLQKYDINTPEEIKPFFSVPLYMTNELISLFVARGAEMNLRTENENHLKGKLEATEKHLEDMREFSKLFLMNKLGKK